MPRGAGQHGGTGRTICVFTGNRAEYGLLKPVMELLQDDPDCRLAVIASAAHLSPEFGETRREIEADGFCLDAAPEVLLSSDTDVGACTAVGLGLIRYADALRRIAPDILVLLGDRFETFAAAAAGLMLRIPVAHIHGGEATRGAMDDALRHAVTKLSHLHFTAAAPYRDRVIQMGEDPARVFDVGAPGVEQLLATPLMTREELAGFLDFPLGPAFLLATFHPPTAGGEDPCAQCAEMLAACDRFPGLPLVVTKANADPGGRAVNAMLEAYAAQRPGRVLVRTGLGRGGYASAMRHAAAVIGNSSSGIIEAPSLGVPVVNIGDRQEGRVRAASVIDCPASREDVAAALARALSPEFAALAARTVNPYEKPGTAARIVTVLKTFPLEGLLKKTFHDLPWAVRSRKPAGQRRDRRIENYHP